MAPIEFATTPMPGVVLFWGGRCTQRPCLCIATSRCYHQHCVTNATIQISFLTHLFTMTGRRCVRMSMFQRYLYLPHAHPAVSVRTLLSHVPHIFNGEVHG